MRVFMGGLVNKYVVEKMGRPLLRVCEVGGENSLRYFSLEIEWAHRLFHVSSASMVHLLMEIGPVVLFYLLGLYILQSYYSHLHC